MLEKISKLFTDPKNDVALNSNYVSDVFSKSNRTLFEFVDDPEYPNGPFNNCTRTLLVDSILTNMDVHYELNKKSCHMKGLPSLLDEDYFEEAFVLHDTTLHKDFNKLPNNYIKESFKDYVKQEIEHLEKIVLGLFHRGKTDLRADLHENWAASKNIYKAQPLPFIKDYFGEKNALYFAFVGWFITSLWIPGVVGAVFFIIGISMWFRYFYY